MSRSLSSLFGLLLILLWTLFLIWIFHRVDFSKSYSNDNEIAITKALYGWTLSFSDRWNHLHVQSGNTYTPSYGKSVVDSSLENLVNLTSMSTGIYTGYQIGNKLSFDDIVDSITIQGNIDSFGSLEDLKQHYETTHDFGLASDLINQLVRAYNYEEAYQVVQTLDTADIIQLNPYLVMNILFNSPLIQFGKGSSTTIEYILQEFVDQKLLSPDDKQRYYALISLINNDTQGFRSSLPNYGPTSTSPLRFVVNDIKQKLIHSSQGNDIPAYYSDGMIALGLFQYGYPQLAQELSLQILLKYPNYTLPKQILAYSHMILHERSQAQAYFLQLIESDSKNTINYQFFAGITSYRLGKYTDSILYLSQIPDDKLVSDAVRYKILSYTALKDSTHSAEWLKRLLAFDDIQGSDMVFAREQLVFEDYILGNTYTLLQKDSSLLKYYLDACDEHHIDILICRMGDIANDIASHRMLYTDQDLKTLIERFPRSYLYYILGDYYYHQGDIINAQKAYISAISITRDPTIKSKILQILQDIS